MLDASYLAKIFAEAHSEVEKKMKPEIESSLSVVGSDITAAQSYFCSAWPKAQTALNDLMDVAAFIPVVANSIPALKGLIAIGEEVQKQTCGGQG